MRPEDSWCTKGLSMSVVAVGPWATVPKAVQVAPESVDLTVVRMLLPPLKAV